VTDFNVKTDALFVGMGNTPVCYYRCMLPAMALGADWVGVGNEPPNLIWTTGLVKDGSGEPRSVMPDFSRYKVIVLQQFASKAWREFVEKLREAGVKVVWECDDYLHGIQHLDDHDFKAHFDKSLLWDCEQMMKRCDALIASTEWIRGNYSHFQRNAYVCRNGLDVRRYELTMPERQSINIGWAGATGHLKAVIPWFQQVAAIMRMREDVNFISIGQDFARGFQQHFGNQRAIPVPWAAIEQYPAAMTMFDIALAPGGTGGWYRGKSDLRWLEAGALGIPAIVNPQVYPDVVDGENGFTAENPMEFVEKLMGLLGSTELRTTVGASARRHVREKRDIKVMSKQWLDVFDKVLSDEVPRRKRK